MAVFFSGQARRRQPARARRLAVRTALAAGLLAGLMSLTGSQVFAATSSGNSDTGAILPVNAASSQTATPNACTGALNTCGQEILAIINADRAQRGLPSLRLKTAQSVGQASCVGAYGHSVAMAKSKTIWHVNTKFPRASFPKSICVHYVHAGENVGESASGNVHGDLKALDDLMMSEPHSHATCATTVNHACNILNPAFRHVGIGVYYVSGATWLTEDFTD